MTSLVPIGYLDRIRDRACKQRVIVTFQTSLTKTMCQKDTEKIYFSITILAAVINGHLTCQIKNCLSIKNKFNNNNNRQFSKGK